MGFRINTNIAAMNSHRNAVATNAGLDKSLNALSSGLRINKAADDASGMTIADSLRTQANGLGQAIKNANDGVAVVQTADGALDEYISIVDRVRTLAIQAASDGQNTASRGAIQSDIDRLLEEAQNIVDTTSFNGLNLLNGTFTDKNFQIGAYANETVSISIGNASTTHVGRIAQTSNTADVTTDDNRNIMVSADLSTVTAAALADGTWAGFASSSTITINGNNIGGLLAGQGSSQLSAEGMAAALNRITDETGITATAETSWAGTTAVVGATVADGGILINGVNIGGVSVSAGDASGTLETAINAVKSQTGVTASTDASGIMTLTSNTGRNIALSGASVSTLGGGFAANATSVTFTATDTVVATEFNIDGVNLSYTGSVTAATAGGNLATAISGAITAGTLSDAYTVTDNGNGTVGLSRADGKDINIIMASDNADPMSVVGADPVVGAVTTGALVVNNSYEGQVTMTSSSAITIAGDATALTSFGLTATSVSASGGISDADVTTYAAAQITIQRADSALTSLDGIRSDIGSVQNQLESTIRNISVTQVNVAAAESQIRDVDFAAESANFAKLNILAQSGSYAMSQANAVQQNVLRLLQ
ncbi:flagellin [Epsilonproteobacteria bacterium SCGC AD-308-O04]|jgi:flagellin|nr:flagellin [Epsilonproteobacteria bacterium SCGC AD-308-O04]